MSIDDWEMPALTTMRCENCWGVGQVLRYVHDMQRWMECPVCRGHGMEVTIHDKDIVDDEYTQP